MWRFSSWFFRFIFFIFYFFLPSRIPAQRHPLHHQSTAAVSGHLLRPSVNRLGPLTLRLWIPPACPPLNPLGVRDRLIFSNCADRQDSATVAANPFWERVSLAASSPCNFGLGNNKHAASARLRWRFSRIVGAGANDSRFWGSRMVGHSTGPRVKF